MLDINENELFEEAVSEEKLKIRARAEAQRQVAEESGAFVPVRFSNQRTEPESIAWRIDGLLPANGYVLLQARRKSGKTTLVGNLVRALVSAGDFLGEFRAHGRCRVGLLDLEMSENRHKQWLKEMGLLDEPKLYTEYLRGRARSLDLFSDEHRLDLAEHIQDQGIDVLVVDPLGPLLRAYGVDENSNSEVGRIVDHLIKLKEEAGVSELVVVHHQGKDGGQGARGASVLEDSPDAIWSLSVKGDERRLTAFGRDVDDSRTLFYNPGDRSYAATATDADDEEADGYRNEEIVFAAIVAHPGASGNAAYSAAREGGFVGNKEKFSDVLDVLATRRKVVNNGSSSRPKWEPLDTVPAEF